MAELIRIPDRKNVYGMANEALTAVGTVASCTFFLWMFFATTPLERMADMGLITADAGQNPNATAYAFAAQWRHGMARNSPLYMPGFFITATAVWFWSMGKSLRRMLVEAVVILGIAFVLADALVPFGVSIVLERFWSQTGCAVSGAISGRGAIAAPQAIYTLLTWGTFVIASRFALRQRSFKPLLAPSLLGIVLALVRPWTVGDLASLWIQRSFNAEPAATLSFVAVPILGIFLGLCEFKQRSQQTLMHAIAAACRGQRRCR
jgi:hypothetical protein